MGALKWVGYIVAAFLVLAVISGVGMFLAAVVFFGGALVSVVGLVLGVASIIKEHHEPTNSNKLPPDNGREQTPKDT